MCENRKHRRIEEHRIITLEHRKIEEQGRIKVLRSIEELRRIKNI